MEKEVDNEEYSLAISLIYALPLEKIKGQNTKYVFLRPLR